MEGSPIEKIKAHSTEDLKKMPAEALIVEAQKALKASRHSFDWFGKKRTEAFFRKQEQDDETKQTMHDAYAAGDYARHYYYILRDVFLQKQGFPLENDTIGDISKPLLHIFPY